MPQSALSLTKPMRAIRTIALRLPEVLEGAVCDKIAFKARGKMFLSLGQSDDSYNLMLKLGDSLAEAALLATKEPGSYKVGVHGWVTIVFRHNQSAPAGLLERWIDESYRLLAPKQPATKSAKTATKKRK